MRSSKCIIFQSPNKEMYDFFHYGIISENWPKVNDPFKIPIYENTNI